MAVEYPEEIGRILGVHSRSLHGEAQYSRLLQRTEDALKRELGLQQGTIDGVLRVLGMKA